VSRSLLAGVLLAALSGAACAAAPTGPGVATLGAASTTTAKPSSSAKDDFAQALAFSACMRSHGVSKFPDPSRGTDGGFQLRIDGKGGVDPNSATFQAAQRACQSLQPGGGPGSAKVDPTKIEPWVACLRAHGVPRFPDPTNSGGQLTLDLTGTGIDPGSSVFQNAMKACRSQNPGGGIGIRAGNGAPPTGGGA
jgi:hypothetical protein